MLESITAVRRCPSQFGLVVVLSTAIGEQNRSVQFTSEWHTDAEKYAKIIIQNF